MFRHVAGALRDIGECIPTSSKCEVHAAHGIFSNPPMVSNPTIPKRDESSSMFSSTESEILEPPPYDYPTPSEKVRLESNVCVCVLRRDDTDRHRTIRSPVRSNASIETNRLNLYPCHQWLSMYIPAPFKLRASAVRCSHSTIF